jgi:hypothetical protein
MTASSVNGRPDITAEMAADAVKQAGSMRAAGKLLNCDEKVIARRLRESAPQVAKVASPSIGFDLDTLKKKHDKRFIIPGRIEAALAKLGDNGMYEAEFLKLADVSKYDIPPFREDFIDHIAFVDKKTKRVWIGNKKKAAEFRAGLTT